MRILAILLRKLSRIVQTPDIFPLIIVFLINILKYIFGITCIRNPLICRKKNPIFFDWKYIERP